jgi:hypothetical protein
MAASGSHQRRCLKRAIPAVSDGSSQGCEERFRVLDAGHGVECRCGFRVINFQQAVDLLDVENGVPLKGGISRSISSPVFSSGSFRLMLSA